MSKIIGIDEAGRGPVIGPMIIVGYVLDSEKIQELIDLGVKDSKELTKREREELYDSLISLGDEVITINVSNEEINKWMSEGRSLNNLELKKFAEILKKVDVEKAYIDSPTRNLKKARNILRSLIKKDIELIVENKADRKYPVVSAASIIAKVIRDREIEKIKEEVGIDFGSGYPSDEKTVEALRKHLDKLKKYVRIEWKTYKDINNTSLQKNLLDFLNNL